MKVGDYVRTKDGQIDKIKKISKEYYERADDEEEKLYKIYQLKNKHYDEEFDENNEWVFEDYIIKSSSSIIDLIEENDFVNHSRVVCIGISTDLKGTHKYLVLENGSYCPNRNIKSILTKEQFESMKYKVKE